MQRLQRKAGLFLPRTADDAQVGLLLKDFDDGDKILKTVYSSPQSPIILRNVVADRILLILDY